MTERLETAVPPFFLDALREGMEICFEATVDEEAHRTFADLSGDGSPIHCDPAFCRRTSFQRPLGYAFHLTALLSRLYGMYLPGGSSICLQQEGRFLRPFFVGDRLRVAGKVAKVSLATRLVEIDSTVTRNGGETVFRGKGVVQVLFDRKEFQPLYRLGEQLLFAADFAEALAALGVCQGDSIFVHSDISVFGGLAAPDRAFLLEALIDSLKRAVGPKGRLVMPTFTYSFCKQEPFDVARTKSTVGVLTEHFRSRPGVVRSRHPIFSVAVDAPDAMTFAQTGNDAFGRDGIFGKMFDADGQLVFLGAPFASATFIHYVEQMRGVAYRYPKTFSGEIVDENGSHAETCSYYVRDLKRNPILDLSRLRQRLLDAGRMKEAAVGAGVIAVVSCRAMFDEANRLLDEDPYGLLEGPV